MCLAARGRKPQARLTLKCENWLFQAAGPPKLPGRVGLRSLTHNTSKSTDSLPIPLLLPKTSASSQPWAPLGPCLLIIARHNSQRKKGGDNSVPVTSNEKPVPEAFLCTPRGLAVHQPRPPEPAVARTGLILSLADGLGDWKLTLGSNIPFHVNLPSSSGHLLGTCLVENKAFISR